MMNGSYSDVSRTLTSVIEQLAESIEPYEDDQVSPDGGEYGDEAMEGTRKLVKTIEECIEQLGDAEDDMDRIEHDVDDKLDELRDLL